MAGAAGEKRRSAPPSDVREIAQGETIAFERRAWIVERAGWALMAAFAVAGLAGLFGEGPLSDATVCDDAGAVCVRYERFLRRGALAPIQVDVAAGAPRDALGLHLSQGLLAALELHAVSPEPTSRRLAGGALELAWSGPSAAGSRLRLVTKPLALGPQRGAIALGGGAPLALRFWVHP